MEYRRALVQGGTFFFTVVTAGRRPLLADDKAVGVLRDAFKTVRAKRPFLVEAMVVLPDHLHCIWTLPSGDADFAARWRLIKTWFTKQVARRDGRGMLGYASLTQPTRGLSRARKGEREVWQRRYWEHVIRDEGDFRHHVEYIHYNPVKHGLVGRPIDWSFSSFGQFVEAGAYTEDWGDGGVSLPEDVGSE